MQIAQALRVMVFDASAAALTVQADRPLTLPPEYGTPVRFRRLFNPVGGFQSVVLTLPAEHPFTVTLKIGDKE